MLVIAGRQDIRCSHRDFELMIPHQFNFSCVMNLAFGDHAHGFIKPLAPIVNDMSLSTMYARLKGLPVVQVFLMAFW